MGFSAVRRWKERDVNEDKEGEMCDRYASDCRRGSASFEQRQKKFKGSEPVVC